MEKGEGTGLFTDGIAVTLGGERLGELRVGGTDEGDSDRARRGYRGCGGHGEGGGHGGGGRDHGGQEGEGGDREGFHYEFSCVFWVEVWLIDWGFSLVTAGNVIVKNDCCC